MKKTLNKPIIGIIVIVIVLVVILAIVLLPKLFRYEEPDLPGLSQESEQSRSPFGMYDYSKRAFLTNSTDAVFIYKGDAYYLNGLMELMRVPLSGLSADLRTEKKKMLPESYTICQDQTHNHNTMSLNSEECPDAIGDIMGKFLIDAYESAGDFPIIYYYGSNNADAFEDLWDQSATYEIYRYDTGKASRECLVSLNNPPTQLMTYDQTVFFITQTASNQFTLNQISKSGGTVTTAKSGEGALTLLGVYQDQIIFRDGDATIYQAGFDLQNIQEIYQVEEDLSYSMAADGYNSVFVHDGYLYFSADYEAVPFELNPSQWMNLLRHTIRRLALKDPKGEGEIVAENVLDFCVYGIVDDVLYFSPCVGGEINEGYYYNFTGGLLKGVNVKTLEPVEMNEDCGLYFGSTDAPMCSNALIGTAFPVRKGYHIKSNEGYYKCLYDIQTGALYPLYTTSDV